MMTPHSQRGSEDHFTWHSTTLREPPIRTSTPLPEEENRGSDKWGNTMGKKQHTMVQVLFQNVSGFLVDKEMEVKLEALQRTMMDCIIDIFGFTESNTSWGVLPDDQRLAKQTRGWWETSHWCLTHNQTESNRKQNNTKAYQPGGAGILCINQIAH